MSADLKKGKFLYWHCTGRPQRCTRPHIKDESITSAIADRLQNLRLDEDVLKTLSRALDTNSHEQDALKEEQESKERDRILGLRKQVEMMYRDKLSGLISATEYRSYREEVESEIEGIEADLRILRSMNGHSIRIGRQILELQNSLRDRFLLGDADTRWTITSAVFSNCVWTEGALHVEYRQPLDSIAVIATMCRNGIAVLGEKNGDCPELWTAWDRYRTFFLIPTSETKDFMLRFQPLL
ncbi:MAG: hypothetical protein M5R41_06350 [Bacteroidia bacterium]|nr:hypothetical protein [Bacteroidia bacterium]